MNAALHWAEGACLSVNEPQTSTPAGAAHPLAAKWDQYYAAGGPAPFDSSRPASQLVDYLCSCLHDKVGRSTDMLEPAALANAASKAPLCLPAAAVGQHDLHNCEQCRAYKPPPGAVLLFTAILRPGMLNRNKGLTDG
jgi:hypothetical protein